MKEEDGKNNAKLGEDKLKQPIALKVIFRQIFKCPDEATTY